MSSVWGVFIVRWIGKVYTSQFISLRLSLTCFDQVIFNHQEFCTSSSQYFTIHLKSSLVADTIIRNVSATGNTLWRRVCVLLVFLTYHDARFR